MNTLLTAILTRLLMRVAIKLNKEEYHKLALTLKRKDIEDGYETYTHDDPNDPNSLPRPADGVQNNEPLGTGTPH